MSGQHILPTNMVEHFSNNALHFAALLFCAVLLETAVLSKTDEQQVPRTALKTALKRHKQGTQKARAKISEGKGREDNRREQEGGKEDVREEGNQG